MPETKKISNSAVVNVESGNNMNIHIYYDELIVLCGVTDLPNTLKSMIPIVVGSENGVPFIEGELVLTLKNSPQDINYMINANGELIVITSLGVNDADKYSINADGDLIYEVCP